MREIIRHSNLLFRICISHSFDCAELPLEDFALTETACDVNKQKGNHELCRHFPSNCYNNSNDVFGGFVVNVVGEFIKFSNKLN